LSEEEQQAKLKQQAIEMDARRYTPRRATRMDDLEDQIDDLEDRLREIENR
jgi:hypothetical protein